jgi:hypothetical protein
MTNNIAPARSEESVAEALGSHGTVVAYQVGQRFRKFTPVQTEDLASVFDAHGFPDSAKALRVYQGDSVAALTTVVSRRGKSHCGRAAASATKSATSGHSVEFTISKLETDNPDVKSWGIYRHERAPGERSRSQAIGARVYATPDCNVWVAEPVDASPDEACLGIAQIIAAEARSLLVASETSDVSYALGKAYLDAKCFSFISRGSYVATYGTPETARLISLINALESYWDGQARAGVRVRYVKVTQADVQTLSESVVDDLETRVAELVGHIRDYSGRGPDGTPLRKGTLSRRREDAERLLADIEQQKALIGEWAERFASRAQQLRSTFATAVDGLSLELPDWADDCADEDEGAAVRLPAAAPPVVVSAPVEPAPDPEWCEFCREQPCGCEPDDFATAPLPLAPAAPVATTADSDAFDL